MCKKLTNLKEGESEENYGASKASCVIQVCLTFTKLLEPLVQER